MRLQVCRCRLRGMVAVMPGKWRAAWRRGLSPVPVVLRALLVTETNVYGGAGTEGQAEDHCHFLHAQLL